MAGGTLMPATSGDEEKASVLVRRRSILLALCAATPVEATSLRTIIQNGYLTTVKSWLDDILSGSTGGIEYLIHMINSIAYLPVTRETVASSKLGRAVVAIEKHTLVTSLEDAKAVEDMKERILLVKNEWSAVVKREKEVNGNGIVASKDTASSPTAAKRAREVTTTTTATNNGSETSKKAKVSSISDLIRRGTEKEPISAAEAARQRAKERQAAESARLEEAAKPVVVTKSTSGKNVAWADERKENDNNNNSPETFETVHEYEAEYAAKRRSKPKTDWSDQKKQDHVGEKKQLDDAKKKAELTDRLAKLDAMCAALTPWSTPATLTLENPLPQPSSMDTQNEARRITSVQQNFYTRANASAIPSEPTPLSDIEQTLEMTTVSTAPAPTAIPFFLPKEQPVAVPAEQAQTVPMPQGALLPPPSAVLNNMANPLTAQQQQPMLHQQQPMGAANYMNTTNTNNTAGSVVVAGQYQMTAVLPTGATPEMVRALGLPSFLVGSDVNALNTLAASPSLMSSFVDAQGRFDQARLLNMVQVLSQQSTAVNHHPTAQPRAAGMMPQPHQQAMPGYGGAANPYGAAAATTNYYGQQQQQQQQSYYGSTTAPSSVHGGNTTNPQFKPKNYRGEQNGDGNLHLSGYGHSITESDIYAVFSPHVHVDEVVMKSTFSFVNTSDPPGAQRAMMMLQGTFLGGRPIKISSATRRAPDPSRRSNANVNAFTGAGAAAGAASNDQFTYTRKDIHTGAAAPATVALPQTATGEIDLDSVYDDRGNVATKNLFVAGYGAGTSEQMLQSTFAQFGTVTGIVMKSTFCFVNTTDRNTAVKAREALTGSNMNGGSMRINFAKESGRLGTSFDASRGGSSMGGYYGRS